MASNTVKQTVHDDGHRDSDPLAELGRIMGLESRPAADGAEFDLAMDLEQELLGDLAAAPADSPDEEIETAFDDVFGDLGVEAEASEGEPAADLAEAERTYFEAPPRPESAFGEAGPVAFEEPLIESVEDHALDAADELNPADDIPALELDEAEIEPLVAEAADGEPVPFDLEAPAEGAGDYESPTLDGDWMADEISAGLEDEEPVADFPVVEAVASVEPVAQETIAPETALYEPVAQEDAAHEDVGYEVAASLEEELSMLLDDAAGQPAVVSAPEEVRDLDVAAGEQPAEIAFDLPELGPVPDEPLAADIELPQEFRPFAPEPVAAMTEDDISFDDDFEIDAADLNAAFEAAYPEHEADEAVAAEIPGDAVAMSEDEAFEAELRASLDAFDAAMARPAAAVEPETSANAVFAQGDDAEFEPVVAETETRPGSRWPAYASREVPAAPAASAAAPQVDESDPFAALAALAATPPILRTLGRANPVAIQPAVERAAPRPPVEQAILPERLAPSPVSPVAEAPQRPDPATPQAQRPRSLSELMAAQAPAEAPAAPAPVQPSPARTTAPAPRPAPNPAYASYPSFVQKRDERGTAAPAYAPASHSANAFGQPDGGSSWRSPERVLATAGAGTSVAAPALAEYDFGDLPDLEELLEQDFSPVIETLAIDEEPVALADDLDIPDLQPEEPAPLQPEFDDFEREFRSAFRSLSADESRDWSKPARAGVAPASYRPAAPVQPAPAARIDDIGQDAADPDLDAALARFAAEHYGDESAFDPASDVLDEEDFDDEAEAGRRPGGRRGLAIAAIVAAVAVVGGIGAFALSFDGAGDGEAAVVRADPGPVKVKPENPGGVVVPNQDGKVYQRVAGETPLEPAQEKLITATEEPIDPAAPVAAAPGVTEEASLPGVEAPQFKSEDRVLPDDTAEAGTPAENVAIAPRKVRTMVVRPDGTLVPREATPAPAAPPVTGTVPQPDPQTVAVATPSTPVPSAVDGAADDVSILPPEDAAPSDAGEDIAVPADVDFIPAPRPDPRVAAAPARATPAPQPQPQPQPVAAPPATPAPAAPAPVELAGGPAAITGAGLWSVQIASQPTREGAQASYVDLARRYASILDGKGVNIVAAEISGKGTMWRVRIPSASRNDANILCAKLKTAGGSCFVSQ